MRQLKTKPEAIRQLEQELGFELTDITNIPAKERSTLSQPKTFECNEMGEVILLNLNECALEKIPTLTAFEKLLVLHLSGNEISRIEGLDSLPNLQSLDLRSNQLIRIEGLDSLPNLKELDLSSNQLSCIEGLDTLSNLQNLDLRSNQLTRIEGLDTLSNLQNLDLRSNQLTRIDGLDSLSNLQNLDLSSNQLTRIEGLDSLSNLRELYLSSNKLTRIEGLDSLSNLRELYLNFNQLTRIEGLDSLPNLRKLSLSFNQLTVIENLPQENKLNFLSMEGNNIEYIRSPLSGGESELLPCRLIFTPYGNHLADIRRWQKQNSLPKKLTLPIKVMLLGNHASGKSTFLNFLRKEEKETESTHVLQISKIEDLGANFYDFGGQDFYHGIYHAFYSTGALYMLFWRHSLDKNSRGEEQKKGKNIRKKILNFDRNYWLEQIHYANQQGRIAGQDTADGENVLVVQTHADCDTRQNLKETKCSVREEFYIALKRKKRGTMELQKLLQQQDELAKRYLHFRLKEEITRLKEKMSIHVTLSEKVLYDYITQTRGEDTSNPIRVPLLRKELKEKGYTDTLASLKGELHQLYLHGEVLYYKDDEELSNLVWLNPEATVNYIHTEILNKESVGKGVVVKEKLLEGKSKDLIRLLELEKVIYDNGKEYIIPGYLPLAEGDEMYEWLTLSYLQPNITLKFEHFIPFGLINQLICYYGRGKNELKKFWRDQLFFTLVNTTSEEERIKRERESLSGGVNKGSASHLVESRVETYPEGRYMVWISLNHEKLTIEVYIKPVDKGIEHRVDKVECMLLQDILDMYWNNLPPDDNEIYLSRRRQGHRRLRRDFPIKDLYISTSKLPLYKEQSLFVKLSTIDQYDPKKEVEEVGISRGMAVAYPLQDRGELDKENPQSVSLRAFQHLTDNEYIGKMKKVFISYSKDDKAELRTCLQFFKPLEDSGRVTLYYDERTEVGAEIHPTIRKEIEEADVIVVLVSPYLLATDYITRLELPLAKQLGKRIFPFVLKPCMWEDNEIINAVYVSLKGEQGASEKVLFDRKSRTYVSDGMQLDVWKKFIEEFKKKIL